MNAINNALNGEQMNGDGAPLPIAHPDPQPLVNGDDDGADRPVSPATDGNGEPVDQPAAPVENPAPQPAVPVATPETVPASALEEKQALLAHLVKLVSRKVTHGLFCWGSGGMGKSRVISDTLAKEGINPVLCNSHITAMSLYGVLYEHRNDKVIWLDDCDGCFTSLPVLGLLRSALWGQQERVVTYNSSALKNMPNRFTFESRIVMCANSFPKGNEAFKAALSRIDVFHLTLSNEEVIEHMRLLAAKGFDSLPAETCNEVIDFISSSGGTRQLSMRMYEPSMKKVLYTQQQNGVDWRDLVSCQLEQVGAQDQPKALDSKRHLLALLAQAIANHPTSTEEQRKWWCKTTRKSRATFFRLKRELEKSHERKGLCCD